MWVYSIPEWHSSLYAQNTWYEFQTLNYSWEFETVMTVFVYYVSCIDYTVLPVSFDFSNEIIWQHWLHSLPTSSLSSSGFRHRIPLAQKQVVTPAGHFLSHLSINWGYSCWYCLYCVQDSLYIFVPLSYGSQLYFSFSKVGSSIGNPQA